MNTIFQAALLFAAGQAVKIKTKTTEYDVWNDPSIWGDVDLSGGESLICGPGTEWSISNQTCESLCGAGEEWSLTEDDCIPVCGPGTEWSPSADTCESVCGAGDEWNFEIDACEPAWVEPAPQPEEEPFEDWEFLWFLMFFNSWGW